MEKTEAQSADGNHRDTNADPETLHRQGLRPIRLRTRPSKLTAEKARDRRHLGLGQLFLTGEIALEAIRKLDIAIEQAQKQEPPCDPRRIVALMRLQLEFNKKLLESGQALVGVTPVSSPDDPLKVPDRPR